MKRFIILGCWRLCVLSLSGQCPDKDSLWKKIVWFKSNTTVSSDEKLAALLNYEAGVNRCPYRYD